MWKKMFWQIQQNQKKKLRLRTTFVFDVYLIIIIIINVFNKWHELICIHTTYQTNEITQNTTDPIIETYVL